MKIVMNSDGVARAWRNQSQAEARTPHRNFWFRGASLYSYATEIARHHGGAVFVTPYSWSSTTGRHLSTARGGGRPWFVAYGSPSWRGSSLNLDPAAIVDGYADEIRAALGTARRARSTWRIRCAVESAARHAATLRQYAAMFAADLAPAAEALAAADAAPATYAPRVEQLETQARMKAAFNL